MKRAEGEGASEDLASALIMAGIAHPERLSATLDTDTFLELAIGHWARPLLLSQDIRECISLECTIGNTVFSPAYHGRDPGDLSITVSTYHYLDWQIGPFLEKLAERNKRAAATVLSLIENCLYYETFGPTRAKECRERQAEMEAEIVEADEDPGEERTACDTCAPAFEYLEDVKAFDHKRAVALLEPILEADVHEAIRDLVSADTRFHRLIRQTEPDQIEFTIPAMFQIYGAAEDAVQQAWDDEAHYWASDVGPTYGFSCPTSDPEQVKRCFGVMGSLLRVYDALGNLRSLTNTPTASS